VDSGLGANSHRNLSHFVRSGWGKRVTTKEWGQQ
jgi:hypothetical protein